MECDLFTFRDKQASSVQLIFGLSQIIMHCGRSSAVYKKHGSATWPKVCGTSDGHTLDSRDCVRLEASNPDGPFLCELALSILIIIRVKRGSSLSPIALADMAQGKAKTDPENTSKQQSYSLCWRYRHTHMRTRITGSLA